MGPGVKRGDVILVRFPHPSGKRGKKRPAVVIQADEYKARVASVVAAEVTTNLSFRDDPACLYIDPATPDGAAAGVRNASVVSCLLLVTVYADTIDQKIGVLSPELLSKLEECLRTALGLRPISPPAANP